MIDYIENHPFTTRKQAVEIKTTLLRKIEKCKETEEDQDFSFDLDVDFD